MADTKISALSGATTPLAGAEVVPIVQSSTTKNVSIDNLTAGRNVAVNKLTASDQVLGTANGTKPPLSFSVDDTSGIDFISSYLRIINGGADYMDFGSGAIYVNYSMTAYNNIIQGTAAKGINFTANTPAAGMTSQLLNWYEEGTWTPSQGVGLTVVGTFSSSGTYTRVGRQVTVIANLNATTSITASAGGIACEGLPFTVSGASVGSLTTNDLTQSSSASAYSNRLYSSSATTAAAGLIITVTYFV